MSSLSQEQIDQKIAEAMEEASILSQPTKRKAHVLTDYNSDQEYDDDGIRVTSDEFLDGYSKYELQFINDDWQPTSGTGRIKPKKQKKNATTSTATSTTATVTKSTASKATTGATTKTTPAKKPKVLKKDVELPVKIDLIDLVKQEKCLYNLKDPMYMSRVHKQMIWEKISTTLMENYADMTADKCKKMWIAVRESTR